MVLDNRVLHGLFSNPSAGVRARRPPIVSLSVSLGDRVRYARFIVVATILSGFSVDRYRRLGLNRRKGNAAKEAERVWHVFLAKQPDPLVLARLAVEGMSDQGSSWSGPRPGGQS